MCLTIPKKVISIGENNLVTVELPDGTRQELKKIVELKLGDWVFSQQNIVVEKISQEEADEIFNITEGNNHDK